MDDDPAKQAGSPMGLVRTQNRRRIDGAAQAASLREAARRALATLGWLGVAVGMATAGFFSSRELYRWATTSPTFAVKKVEVTGLHRASEAELLRLGGLALGQNLFRVDPSAASRAMRTQEWVRSVEVSRRLPDRIWVRVVEHEPAALAVLGDLYLVDREGVPFKKAEAGDGVDLPLVTGLGREAYAERPDEASAHFREALALESQYTRLLPGRADRVSEVRIGPFGFALVVGERGEEVQLGTGPFGDKLARLVRVREELKRRSIVAEVIRLDNRARPDWVAVRVSQVPREGRGGRTQFLAP